jgi:predicted metal-dependent hydrolase
VDSDLYFRGLDLFNRAAFFDAHEILEDVWRPSVGAERRFLQGLIQTAVALHHHSKGNLRGARSLLGRGMANLAGYPDNYGGIRLDLLLASLKHWQEALLHNFPAPALPRIILQGAQEKSPRKSDDPSC